MTAGSTVFWAAGCLVRHRQADTRADRADRATAQAHANLAATTKQLVAEQGKNTTLSLEIAASVAARAKLEEDLAGSL